MRNAMTIDNTSPVLSTDERIALKRAASDAIAVQNACNISGILNAWARAQTAIRAATRSSEAMTTHPVQLLFLSKITSLMGVNSDSIGSISMRRDGLEVDVYIEADRECSRLAGEAIEVKEAA
jgi:hypothetical protein